MNHAFEDEPITVAPATREAAHLAIDRWLDDCEREANEMNNRGSYGGIGELKLTAASDDCEVLLELTRSITTTVGGA